jgi:exonuclease VII small subunit
MFERSNKLNKRSLALWKQCLKLRQKADKLLTDLMLKDKKQNE